MIICKTKIRVNIVTKYCCSGHFCQKEYLLTTKQRTCCFVSTVITYKRICKIKCLIILNYLVFIGAVGLIIVALIPIVVSGVFSIASISFGGTSIIIIVGVVMESLKQIESKMVVRYYKGFLDD